MALVVLVVHEERPEAVAQADALAAVLVGDGHQVNRSDDPGFTTTGMDDATDLVVSLGGDGSILRAVDLLDGRSAPILGVKPRRTGVSGHRGARRRPRFGGSGTGRRTRS